MAVKDLVVPGFVGGIEWIPTRGLLPKMPVPPIVVPVMGGEFGAGTALDVLPAEGQVIIGPWQTVDRTQLRIQVYARGTVPFDLNYEFSTDKGTTWYVGQQVAAAAVSADDGGSYAREAHGHFNLGYWWRISIFNTDGAIPLNSAFEWRLHEF